MTKSVSEGAKKYASSWRIEHFGKNYIPWVLLAALAYYHALYVHGIGLNSSYSMDVPKMVPHHDYRIINVEKFYNKTGQGKIHRTVVLYRIGYTA